MDSSTACEERRSHARWQGEDPKPLPVRIAGATQLGRIRDVSAGGIALAGDFDSGIGFPALVEVNDALHLPGVVVRICSGVMAIRFILTKPMCQQIDEAIRLGLAPSDW
jgi:hypothetical protein